MKKFIAYYRVSTQKQGQSGLGLEAQQKTVKTYLNGGQWELLAEFTEVESGKGKDALSKRPKLKEAVEQAKKQGAILVIAKLDRLARNVHFVSGLIETGVEFVAADMPQANKAMLQMYSVMAEWERDQISERTKSALAAAKERGVKLGTAGPANLKSNIEQRQQAADIFANRLRTIIEHFKAKGLSQQKICAELNSIKLKAPRGGEWKPTQLQRVMARWNDQPANA